MKHGIDGIQPIGLEYSFKSSVTFQFTIFGKLDIA